jgi:hypothetical protein
VARLRPSTRDAELGADGRRVSKTAAVLRAEERGRFDRVRDLARRTLLQGRTLIERRSAPRQVSWTISTLAQFEESHTSFVEQAMGQFEFVAERPIAYLNWRYCDERAGPFVVRVAEEGGAMLGYAVTRVFRGSAQIADILTLPGRADVAESLIRDAVALAESDGAGQVTLRLPHRHPYRDALRRCGFFDVGHVAGELVAPRRMPGEELAFLDREDARIHLVFADSDFI